MEIELGSVIAGTATALGVITPGGWVLFKWIKRAMKEQISQQNKFIDATVRTLNGTASAIINSYPGPCWIKIAKKTAGGQMEFRMQECNAAYEEMFKKNRLDYIGKTDLEVGWSKEESEEFYSHDLLVWNDGKPRDFAEQVVVNGTARTRYFRKIQICSPSGEVKGVMGYLYEPTHP